MSVGSLYGKKANAQPNVGGLFAKSTELKKRIGFVLMALIVYRLGTHVPLPGIDAAALSQMAGDLKQGLFGMFNMFTGGALSRMAIFTMGVMPYITASIIMQLLTTLSPSLSEMKKEGEAGRRRITQYTRYFAVILSFVQGYGVAAGLESQAGLVVHAGMAFKLQTALIITTSTMFLMWLGDQITNRGIGQGISIIIFAGIVAELPRALFQTFELARVGEVSGFFLMGIAAMVIFVLGFCVFMETAQRKLLVQYPKRQVGMNKMTGGDSSHMPLKLNVAGVIPVIFASSLLAVPVTMAGFNPNAEWAQLVASYFSPGRPLYSITFVALIVSFCFFYTAIVFNPEETAENLKNQGGFIPGIRPGKSTAEYFDWVLTRLTVVGSAYIAAVCVLPEVVHAKYSVPFYFGGTSLLIVVSVTLDLVSRIQTHLLAQRYEGLLKKSQFGKRKKG